MRRTYVLIFFANLFTRLLFINLIGINNNYSLQSDSVWLVRFADQSLNGNFNFDIGRFIASPLFSLLCGLFKVIFQNSWSFYLILFQVVLSSVSGIYICKITLLVFNDKRLAVFSSLVYACFPLTLWYVHTFSQESVFQSLLIISIYYLLVSVRSDKIRYTFAAAAFFSMTYLLKSHILIFSVFIPIVYFHYRGFCKAVFYKSIVFTVVAFAFSLPWGIYNYVVNKTYVISSNGAGYQFYLGNSEAGYATIVNVPEKNSKDYEKMKDITVYAGYFNGSMDHYNSILKLPQHLKQNEFYKEAMKWIWLNPRKFVRLKMYDCAFFLMPGVSFRHYSFYSWLASLVISLPIYLLGYLSIYRQCRFNFRINSWIFYLFLSMSIFSIVWYVQNRFRTITLEPFYIIYASYYLFHALEKISLGSSLINFLNEMFLKYLQRIQFRKIWFG